MSRQMRMSAAILMAAIWMMSSGAQTGGEIPGLIPKPSRCVLMAGEFVLTPETVVVAGASATKEGLRLAEALREATGFAVPVAGAAAGDGVQIELQLDRALGSSLGTEGYRLEIKPEKVTIQSAGEAGLFYGGVTFRQLLPPEICGTRGRANGGVRWRARCVEIKDSPRFGWRGLLLDPARHFLPVEFLKKFVDEMALHKLNTLQLHLTDDQGWRIEIRKHPRLALIGSKRAESPKRGDRDHGDGQVYGPFFYTQAEIRDLVAYAAARHVTILPEIEMPGHFLGALAAYPEYSCTGGPFAVRTRWGVERNILCPGDDRGIEFAKDVLAEVCELFPSKFIHIGGDESPRDRWKACPKCQERIRAEGLKNEAQLQTWFNHRIEEFLAGKGRRMMGWDEILEGGLTPGGTVMSWRGIGGGIAAADAGHDVVMSPTSHCYFDNAQSESADEPESIGGVLVMEKVYGYEPVPGVLAAEKQKHILGAQGNLWGEYLWNGKDAEYLAFPRAAALAEVVWSGKDREYSDFLRRLGADLKRLDEMGVNYWRGARALGGGAR